MRFKFSQIFFSSSIPIRLATRLFREKTQFFSKSNKNMHDFIVFIVRIWDFFALNRISISATATVTFSHTRQIIYTLFSSSRIHLFLFAAFPFVVTLYMIIIFTLCCQNNNLVCVVKIKHMMMGGGGEQKCGIDTVKFEKALHSTYWILSFEPLPSPVYSWSDIDVLVGVKWSLRMYDFLLSFFHFFFLL